MAVEDEDPVDVDGDRHQLARDDLEVSADAHDHSTSSMGSSREGLRYHHLATLAKKPRQ